jgi:hypothetical protein
MEKSSNKKEDQLSFVISYLTIRRLIGILGIVLPIALVIGSLLKGSEDEILPSISCYYHSSMRDLFVGIICAVALFLFAYKGYNRLDNYVSNFGGLFALGVAFLPTTDCRNISSMENALIGSLHLLSAALFFMVLIYFSLFLFTKSDKPKKEWKKPKQYRNKVYYICGYTMLGCILLIAVYFLFLDGSYPCLEKLKPVFWLESISLWSFGISWLAKGEVIFKDLKE